MKLRACQYEFEFPRPALVMGVVNVTPDSFSDGGAYLDPGAAVDHGLELAAQGADIIDVGGESTRPGAPPVSEREELRRVIPVIAALAGRLQRPISIDTMKPMVAREAIAAGASIVNDVGANRGGEEMGRLLLETGAGYVAMHMRGTPQTMQNQPSYDDVVGAVGEFFRVQLTKMQALGVAPEQVMLDVGIGFGKTLEHNLQLLGGLGSFTTFARPLVLGVSRKSFVSKLLGVGVADRLPAGLACTTWAALSGVGIFRTHEVAATVQALRMTEAIQAQKR